ncbi:uncharacterized protein LOC122500154 [Leptopilina heterotoma]|uniref:uncharacterized protein LOC122500154 n=1 Tax=Leptopilina heterotoma TaxID=63436 RepID=UPI001CA8B48D|nr:uncharacterized protein LOC122500154 [Leptopilina heterotoma]
MKFLSGLCLFLIIVYEVQSGVVRREIKNEATNSSSNNNDNSSANNPPGSGGPLTGALQNTLQSLIEIVGKIPILGESLKALLQRVVFIIMQLELITNGSVTRLLGALLPCEISLINGLLCSGITQNGGLTKVLINLIDPLPNLLVPVIAKAVLKLIIKLL